MHPVDPMNPQLPFTTPEQPQPELPPTTPHDPQNKPAQA